jgi:GT2 family glycosyltransferase
MLSIIIVNYKNENETISYIKSELYKVQIPNIIVIVNNECSEESNTRLVNELNAELVVNLKHINSLNRKIFVIPHKDNLGFAKANNLGAIFSRIHFDVSYFLFSNNDIKFIDDDVVDQLINKINCLSNISIIGPRVIGLDNKNQSPEPYYSFFSRYIGRFWFAPFLSKRMKNKFFHLEYSENALEGIHYKLMGSFFICNAKDFFLAGMMDQSTFLYAEEVILSEKLQRIGKKVYYFPVVSVLHFHSKTISSFMAENARSYTQFKSEIYYYKKYKNTSMLMVYIGKLSFSLYITVRNIFKN